MCFKSVQLNLNAVNKCCKIHNGVENVQNVQLNYMMLITA